MLHSTELISSIVNSNLLLFILEVCLLPICCLKRIVQQSMFIFALMFCISTASAQNVTNSSGEDTILIEKEMTRKASFHQAFKSLAKTMFNFDVENLVSGGDDCKSAVIRNFSDFTNRTKYRINLKQEQVEFNFTLNF